LLASPSSTARSTALEIDRSLSRDHLDARSEGHRLAADEADRLGGVASVGRGSPARKPVSTVVQADLGEGEPGGLEPALDTSEALPCADHRLPGCRRAQRTPGSARLATARPQLGSPRAAREKRASARPMGDRCEAIWAQRLQMDGECHRGHREPLKRTGSGPLSGPRVLAATTRCR